MKLYLHYDDQPESPENDCFRFTTFDRYWRGSVNRETYFTDDECVHCGEAKDDHADGKCLFEPTEWADHFKAQFDEGRAWCLYVQEHGPGTTHWYDCQEYDPRCSAVLEWTVNEPPPTDIKPFLEEYGQWCRGEVYGYVVEDEKGEEVDSCWGWYSLDDMAAEIRRYAPWSEIDGDAAWVAEYHDFGKCVPATD